MRKVLVATEKPFAKKAVEGISGVLREAGYEMVLLENYSDKSDLIGAVEDVDGLIVRSDLVTAEVLDAARKLAVVVRAGAGYDNIDLEASTGKSVVVMNTPGQNSNAVAELAIGMMIYMARNQFNGTSGTELRGKKIGIHGCGNVGMNVARIGRGLQMKVIGFCSWVGMDRISFAGVKFVDSVEDLYSNCQYISLSIPANKETLRLVNYDLLSRMPAPAVLVNAARKEVVDEASLLRMFAERPDFQYLTDVAPDCAGEIAEKYPGRYFFTPKKMGAQTAEANINAGIAAARQIVDFFESGETKYQVNK
ncbi:MAG: 3-phosphoglycerate dehydrogenase [Marinilabiliales bacterium]|nr:MAG: 3-phosphoglycerate dehydrogenase [Marinilabiliales bacterium]